jgi:predicted RNA-binding Zn-ribbon protein involved in translation (DUF1610 family)
MNLVSQFDCHFTSSHVRHDMLISCQSCRILLVRTAQTWAWSCRACGEFVRASKPRCDGDTSSILWPLDMAMLHLWTVLQFGSCKMYGPSLHSQLCGLRPNCMIRLKSSLIQIRCIPYFYFMLNITIMCLRSIIPREAYLHSELNFTIKHTWDIIELVEATQ